MEEFDASCQHFVSSFHCLFVPSIIFKTMIDINQHMPRKREFSWSKSSFLWFSTWKNKSRMSAFIEHCAVLYPSIPDQFTNISQTFVPQGLTLLQGM